MDILEPKNTINKIKNLKAELNNRMEETEKRSNEL